MLSIKLYIISAIAIAIGFISITYFITDYFHMKSALNIAEQELQLSIHRRQATEQAMVGVEDEIDKNLSIQRSAILEMEQKGYLSNTNNSSDSNPQWMLDYETQGD